MNKNLNILKEREAKYASNAPLELLNQINDHEQAINLIEQAIAGEMTETELHEALKPLILAITNGQIVNIEADTYVAGDMAGDIVSRDKVSGDKVFGDKIITKIYKTPRYRIPLQRPPRAEYFTGREKELAQLLADLQPGRVVTLCGPGGIGKSALAAEAVWQLTSDDTPPDRFPDGIIFHSFASQPQAEVALENIARTFGEEPKPTPAAAAQRALAGRRLLLLLDSAEDADNLPVVLAVRSGCGVLVTSRSRKDAEAERQDLEPLASEEAVKLLQAWGRRQAADETVVKRISDLVGRLPLAVRLVGRYLEQTGEAATEYLEWLEETPLEALSPGEHREENVALLLEHSLTQVSETARQVLGVAGLLALVHFDRAVIRATLEMSGGEARRVINQLVSYGLLRRAGARFEVNHALIHTYAKRRLAVADEVVRRMVKYYTDLIETQTKLGSKGYTRLDIERAHFMSALATCVEREEWESARRLAETVADDYLNLQGYRTEQIMANEVGLTAAQRLGQRREEVKFLNNLGNSFFLLAQIGEAIKYHQQGLAIAREIGDRPGEGAVLGGLGEDYRVQGEMNRAVECTEQALAIARELGERPGEWDALVKLGNIYHDLSEVDQAAKYQEQSLAIARELGDRRREGRSLGNLGFAYLRQGQVDKAIENFQQGLAIAREFGDRRYEGSRLDQMGLAYRDQGQVNKAIEYHEQALVIHREIGVRRREGVGLWNLGNAYIDLGQVDKAIEYFQQALVIHREIGDRMHQGMGLSSLGAIYYYLGQMEQAIEYYEQALVIYREAGYRHHERYALISLGNVYREMGQVERVVECYQQALAIAREMGDQRREGVVLTYLGKAQRLMERYDEAMANFGQAIKINPDSDWSYYQRGLIYLVKNNHEQARNDFSRAISLARQTYEKNPQSWNTFNLALYSLAIDDFERAKQLYQEAIKGSPPPHHIIREVVRALDDFLNLFPDHSQAQAMHDLLQQSL